MVLPAHPAAAEVANNKEHDENDHDDDDDVLETHRQHLQLEYYAAPGRRMRMKAETVTPLLREVSMARSQKDRSAGAGEDRGAGKDHGAGDDGGHGRSIHETARDHLRAAAGGLFVGLPLLWTMEMWAQGATMPPLKLLLLFGLAFGVVVGFNAVSGFRRERSWVELLVDAVQGMGLCGRPEGKVQVRVVGYETP